MAITVVGQTVQDTKTYQKASSEQQRLHCRQLHTVVRRTVALAKAALRRQTACTSDGNSNLRCESSLGRPINIAAVMQAAPQQICAMRCKGTPGPLRCNADSQNIDIAVLTKSRLLAGHRDHSSASQCNQSSHSDVFTDILPLLTATSLPKLESKGRRQGCWQDQAILQGCWPRLQDAC